MLYCLQKDLQALKRSRNLYPTFRRHHSQHQTKVGRPRGLRHHRWWMGLPPFFLGNLRGARISKIQRVTEFLDLAAFPININSFLGILSVSLTVPLPLIHLDRFSYFNLISAMEVQIVRVAYTRTSMKMTEPEEKDDCEHSETLSLDPPEAKATHFLSRKLLTWGVEARGKYFVSRSWNSIFDQSARPRDIANLIRAPANLTGISPVPVEERTETRFIKIFFIWLSANANILS